MSTRTLICVVLGTAVACATAREPAPIDSGTAQQRGRGKALVLLDRETKTLKRKTHMYSRICVQDDARIEVRGSTTIVLTSDETTIIGGRGIGPIDGKRAKITLETQNAPDIYILNDNAEAPIDLEINAPRSKVNVGLTGKTGLNISGTGASSITYNSGWGLPRNWPFCNRQQDREPLPSFPPSVQVPGTCMRDQHFSSYVQPAPAQQTSELHVIGVYEGPRHVDGTITVDVGPAKKPVVLSLSAYQPTIWQVRIAPQARIRAIYVSGYNPQKVLGVSGNVKIIETGLRLYTYGWEPEQNSGGGSYPSFIRDLREATGLVESSFQGCYAGQSFRIPHTIAP